jgi:N,N'-diacetyllegionaminate synthase
MNTSFSIGNKMVGLGNPVFVIAEVGINHGGDPKLCVRLIEAAAASGADAVKLQIVDVDASYVKGTASYDEFKGKTLSDEALKELMGLSDRLGIVLFSTPGDFKSLYRIIQLGMPAIKISSGLMTNLPLVARAAASGLPLIISTGLAYEQEIDAVLETVRKNSASSVSLLKCTALYPAPDDTINLAAITAMASRYGVPIGYSDHTLDDLACIGAVAQGATVIEKHFTLDSKLPGADHHISMEPEDFARMVHKIRRLTLMKGTKLICATEAEIAVRMERHRCLVAQMDISIGDQFTENNVGLMRPLPGQTGLPANKFDDILGRKATTVIRRNEPINESHIGEKP